MQLLFSITCIFDDCLIPDMIEWSLKKKVKIDKAVSSTGELSHCT